MRTLNLTTEMVNEISELNRQIRERRAAQMTTTENDLSVEAAGEPGNESYVAEFHKKLASLPDVAKQELAALTWFGRGDFEDFDSALGHAGDAVNRGVAGYLSARPLSEHLINGVQRLESAAISLS